MRGQHVRLCLLVYMFKSTTTPASCVCCTREIIIWSWPLHRRERTNLQTLSCKATDWLCGKNEGGEKQRLERAGNKSGILMSSVINDWPVEAKQTLFKKFMVAEIFFGVTGCHGLKHLNLLQERKLVDWMVGVFSLFTDQKCILPF